MSLYVGKQLVTNYAKFRPIPPPSVLQHVMKTLSATEKRSPPFDLAVDVGCGSGQLTELLALHFKNVVGIDTSRDQIQEANSKNQCSSIIYKEGTASSLPISDNSADLVMASQSAHWFNVDDFFKEITRVLKPSGVVALTGYNFPEPQYKNCTDQLLDLIKKFFSDNQHLWHENNKLVIDRYSEIENQYKNCTRIDPLPTDIDADFDYLLQHLQSRSGIQSLQKSDASQASRIMDKFCKDFMSVIKKSDHLKDFPMVIRFNYFLLLWEKSRIEYV